MLDIIPSINAMLDGDAVAVDTLMAIPCHVMQYYNSYQFLLLREYTCYIPITSSNATLDGDAVAVDTLMAIPCHVMQGRTSRRANVAGFRFSI